MNADRQTDLPEGYRLRTVETCDSTNRLCLDAAQQAGEPGRLWIMSRTQTAGKGSRGRHWTSQPGNLYASLLLKDPCKPGDLPQLTFVAALAVAMALKTVVEPTLVSVKWPNDVLVDGRKCAGILLENRLAGHSTDAVIGIGINCCSHPEETAFPATDLSEHGSVLDPLEMLHILSHAMVKSLENWERGAAFPNVRQAWLADAWGLGETVRTVLFDGKTLQGRFDGLTDDGHMQMSLANGMKKTVFLGDVFPISPDEKGVEG